MDTGGGGSGFHGLNLFGATIPMERTQGKENAKESERLRVTHQRRLEKALRYWTVGGTLRNVPFGAGRPVTGISFSGIWE
ncbi:hypothetical protein CKAN_02571900 [Cinnamomum micranthum f. kanehirae]|uniref:Uncharacterized protein n=1 Tax=Cinnamomum micranthum f. kanehirae TaxID=337451 RepID=A0A3S3R948_9MAGN|nr:hypothetical protein CKAN_02571900 [Cinnamomum micranthum f. kanehirae]